MRSPGWPRRLLYRRRRALRLRLQIRHRAALEPERPRRQQRPAGRRHALRRAVRRGRQASRWLPLVHGQGPLTAANGFASQADVVIEARRAADLLGATPMDRPEDVETNPANGRVYVMLTNNGARKAEQVDGPIRAPRTITAISSRSSRPAPQGQVDHAATEATWAIFLLAGKPGHRRRGAAITARRPTRAGCAAPTTSPSIPRAASGSSPTARPTPPASPTASTPPTRWARPRADPVFYQAPTGAEVCGPSFTPDDRTFFLACSIPGEDRGSTLREALDALARLQGRHAAAAFRGGDHPEGRRADRVVIVSRR